MPASPDPPAAFPRHLSERPFTARRSAVSTGLIANGKGCYRQNPFWRACRPSSRNGTSGPSSRNPAVSECHSLGRRMRLLTRRDQRHRERDHLRELVRAPGQPWRKMDHVISAQHSGCTHAGVSCVDQRTDRPDSSIGPFAPGPAWGDSLRTWRHQGSFFRAPFRQDGNRSAEPGR